MSYESLDEKGTKEYQPGRHAWHPGRSDIIELLQQSRHASIQPIYYGSNHTFLVTLESADGDQSLAVYKPQRGEYPLYDFPTGTLYRREVGTWLVNALLGWDVVPPTVVTRGKHGVGSLQIFIESPSEAEVELDDLQRIALLDLLVNNADRKAEHCLPDEEGHLWGIDHGLTFHSQPKLRTIIWHFAGMPISEEQEASIKSLAAELEHPAAAEACLLMELLSRQEWTALKDRAGRLAAIGSFPNPRYKPVPYRW